MKLGTPADSTLHGRRLRTARATILWAVSTFVALQLGLAVSIDHWLPEFRHPCYAVKARRLHQRLSGLPTTPWTLAVLGSSRTTFGFRGACIEAELSRAAERPVVAFNFGMLGAGPVTELLALRRLLNEGIRPNHVLIEIMPPFLSDRPEMMEVNRMPVTVDCLQRNELAVWDRYGASGRGLESEWWLNWPLPWYSHRFSIMSRLAANWLPYAVRQDQFRGIDDSGWVCLLPRNLTAEEHAQRAEAERRTCAPCLKSFRLNPELCQAVRDLLALCRQENIGATLLLMPEAGPLRELYSPSGADELHAFLQNLVQTFDVDLVDARCWMSDDDFIDSDHLHAEGARRFTERLSAEWLLPITQAAQGGVVRGSGAPFSRQETAATQLGMREGKP